MSATTRHERHSHPASHNVSKKSVCWEHISEEHHDGSQCNWWRWCVPRERNRTEYYGLDDGHSSGAVHVQTQWPGDDTSVEAFSACWWTADTRRPRAPVPTPHCRIQCHWRRKALFRFGLCSYPSALFDDTIMPSLSSRGHHRKLFWRTLSGPVCHQTLPDQLARFNMCWTVGHCSIPSTKYTTHQRRTGGKVGIEVTFKGDMKLTIDVEGCLPFERRQQTEFHRNVESLPAACWMPHRTRGWWLRPVDCANIHAIGSCEEHCPHGRRYRSGHPAMLLRRSRWHRLVHAVFDTGDNEEEPHLGYQSHPKWVGCWHLRQHPVRTRDIVTPHPDYMVSEKDCRWRDSPPGRCSEIRLNSSARRTQQLTTA